jgi:hypothetical protein
VDGNPETGEATHPLLVLSMRDGKFIDGCAVSSVPSWAKAIFITSLEQRP